MGEYNFLPIWYRKKSYKNEKIKNRSFYFVLILVGLIFIGRVLAFINQTNELKDIATLTWNDDRKSQGVKRSIEEKENKTITTYAAIVKDIIKENKDYKFDSIIIKENKIYLEKTLAQWALASKFINHVEDIRNYKIVDLDIDSKEEGKVYIKIEIEVMNNENY